MENEDLSEVELILFDVYETLLNMADLEKKVNQLLDSKRGYNLWFELFMQYCFVDNCTSKFNSFSSIAEATMKMAAQTLGKNVAGDEIRFVLELLRHLPIHHEVQPGLSALADKSYRIAALTNSPEATVTARMENTGLISYFERVLSAEPVKKYKPSVEVYNWAAKQLKLDPGKILMVSAHGWDLAGAHNAGMKTGYLRQSKQMLYPLAPKPHLVCKNLEDLANQLDEMRTRAR